MNGPTGSAFRLIACLALAAVPLAAAPPNSQLADRAIEARVDALLERMTLAEKVGQMTGYPAGREDVGPRLAGEDFETLIAAGQVGLLNVADARRANAYQRIAMERARLHIPLLFGFDVLHGYRTVYPIPLGLAATFDPALVTRVSRLAAAEASADGIRMVNSPMVDVSRDARWGRTAEGAGESPFLGAALARAYVRGYQGASLSDPSSVAACVKHFAAYGAVEAGRDYNAVDLSDLKLRQVYLPPYQAAVDAGAAVVMCAFNSLDSVPETENPYTLTEILRHEWGFDGFVRADYNAVAELMAHGVALDGADAAREALLAGVDLDMASSLYRTRLVGLVRGGMVPASAIDEAVRRILRVKFALGLFEHPYVDEANAPGRPTGADRALARRAAGESVVLLKNEAVPEAGPRTDSAPPLPIGPGVRTVALIGPLADSRAEMLGCWHARGRPADVVTLRAALAERLRGRGGRLLYAEGAGISGDSESGFAAARSAAHAADLVILALGEDARTMTGEAASRAHLDLPGRQEQLLEQVAGVGKPTVLVVFSGRPLVLNWAAGHVAAILEAWYPGIEAGPALTDLLFGDADPCGKLPVSFPRAVGQEPLYLSQLPTGRPDPNPDRPPAGRGERFVSAYIDVPNAPLFPFGYGASYTRFAYSAVALSASSFRVGDVMERPGIGAPIAPITATVTVRNEGPMAGTEVVQLYLRIRGASVEEPVRTLEGFRRVRLAPGEAETVRFPLGFDELSFIDARSRRVVEPAEYTVFVGGSSEARSCAGFRVLP